MISPTTGEHICDLCKSSSSSASSCATDEGNKFFQLYSTGTDNKEDSGNVYEVLRTLCASCYQKQVAHALKLGVKLERGAVVECQRCGRLIDQRTESAYTLRQASRSTGGKFEEVIRCACEDCIKQIREQGGSQGWVFSGAKP